MSTVPALAPRLDRVTWTLPGDAFVSRRLREIVEPGERAGACCRIAGAGIGVVATSRGIARVDLVEGADAALAAGVRLEPGLADLAELVARCLLRWEPGAEALPLDVTGTAFQVSAWRALRGIEPGRTISYAGLARRLGHGDGAARAVGQAVGANPVPVLVPCHRVLAAGGAIGGFGCGLILKRRLLQAEGTLA
jgi:O-6-methylguanine DNA methyltransferase